MPPTDWPRPGFFWRENQKRSYSNDLDERCHCELFVEPGRYRLTLFDHEKRRSHSEEVDVNGPRRIEVAPAPARSLAGRLVDRSGTPLANWTVVAMVPKVWTTYLAQTALDGTYRFDSIPAGSVRLHTYVPPANLPTLLAESIALPASGLDHVVEMFAVELFAQRWDDGRPCIANVRVSAPQGFSGKASTARPLEVRTSEDGRAALELPRGSWYLSAVAIDGHANDGRKITIEARPPPPVEFTLMQTRDRKFDVRGVDQADAIRWTATSSAGLTKQETLGLFLIRQRLATGTHLPNGRVRFEALLGEAVLAPAIEVEITDQDPIVLAW